MATIDTESPQNQAAWLDGKGRQLRVGHSEYLSPGPEEVVIRNHAVAVNPVDWKIQDFGIALTAWPNIIGSDIAGVVVEVGKKVNNLQKGDRVAARVISIATQNPCHGGFQLYTTAPASTTGKLPESVAFANAAVLPLAFDTALVGLCASNGNGLGLPHPALQAENIQKTIVVWGGSSSVGALATQLAIAAGAKVVAVASAQNHDFCVQCGATAVADYAAASVVQEVIDAVHTIGGTFAGVFDAVATVSGSLPFVLEISSQLGGGPVAAVLPLPSDMEIPENVEAFKITGLGQITHEAWSTFFTPALESGKLQCLPKPLIVGKGLDEVQRGFNVQRQGVSAQKVVIEM